MKVNTLITNKVPYYMNKGISFEDIPYHISDYDTISSRLIYKGKSEVEPLISIVVPCYNAELLNVAVESALNQDFRYPYEVVIIDNDSEKKDEIEKYIIKLQSPIIRYYRNDENIGLFGNWNRCIVLARAKYMVYLHADDALVPDTLSKLWNVHNKVEEKAAIIGRFITLDACNNEVFRYTKHDKGFLRCKDYYRISKYGLLYGDLCNGCGALLNKDVMKDLGGWNPDYYPGSDRVLFMLYAEKYGLYRINEIVRRETFCISTSSTLYKKYPSVSYYLSRAVILRFFTLKPLWHFCNYHSYLVYNNSKSQWETDKQNRVVPVFSRIIDFLYKMPYRLLGGKRIYFLHK